MPDGDSQSNERPYVGVHLQCCNVYVRAYLNAAGNAYVTFCPRCTTQVRIRAVAEGGSTDHFFSAG
jgi:hypothetical protein